MSSLSVVVRDWSMTSFAHMANDLADRWGGPVRMSSIGDADPISPRLVVFEQGRGDICDLSLSSSFDGVERRVCVFTGNVKDQTVQEVASMLACVLDHRFLLVVHSRYHRDAVLGVAREHLSARQCGLLGESVRYIPYGVSEDFSYCMGDPAEVVVPYSWAGVVCKNVPLHAKSCAKLRAWGRMRGIRFRFPFHYGGHHLRDYLDDYMKVYDMQPLLKGAEYVEACRRYGMFLSTSDSESFGIMYLELLCSGAVGVFLDRPWVRKLLPNYPYVVSKGKLVPMMIWVHQNHDEASARIRDEVIPYIRRTYSLDRFHDALSRLLGRGPT